LVPTLLGLSVLIFVMVRVLPGDAAVVISGGFATQQDLPSLYEHLGLDQPIHVQHIRWMWNCLRDDFERPIQLGVPIPQPPPAKVLQDLGVTVDVLAITRHRRAAGWNSLGGAATLPESS
jgi:ABC-type dipeptide/oligopeptide/nickel transport system permease component